MNDADPVRAPSEDSRALRQTLIDTARGMNAAGINVNKSGNVSVRGARGARNGFLITPTGIPYAELTVDEIVFVPFEGRPVGRTEPSSEWRFHRDILRSRPEFDAIVHTHSRAATALAVHGRGIPAFHYMVAAAGGKDIRCARYATFGTQQLSDQALEALQHRKACLLAHHGVIACDASLQAALRLAIEVENLAQTYLAACVLGEPLLLSDNEMARVAERFKSYGQRDRLAPRM
jgi:L-fuculose-phosphate aldolase